MTHTDSVLVAARPVRIVRGVMGKRKRQTILAGLTLAVTATGCATTDAADSDANGARGRNGGPQIQVDRPTALADQQVDLRATHLPKHARVKITAQAEDWLHQTWSATGTYTTDKRGTVDLGTQAPRGGKPYAGADSTGLLGAMLPERGTEGADKIGSGKAFSFHPEAPEDQRAYKVRLSVRTAGGTEVAHRALERRWLAPGTSHRTLSESKDGLNGELYLPAQGGGKKAPVLLFGGSEGGNAGTYAAALLASHGHPTVALC